MMSANNFTICLGPFLLLAVDVEAAKIKNSSLPDSLTQVTVLFSIIALAKVSVSEGGARPFSSLYS